jgi:hypothetical protein
MQNKESGLSGGVWTRPMAIRKRVERAVFVSLFSAAVSLGATIFLLLR